MKILESKEVILTEKTDVRIIELSDIEELKNMVIAIPQKIGLMDNIEVSLFEASVYLPESIYNLINEKYIVFKIQNSFVRME